MPVTGLAQQYVHAPTSFMGVDGFVAGWMSNLPLGTFNQDWYPGSGVSSACPAAPAPCVLPSETHDPLFLSATGPMAVGGGVTMAPHPGWQDFQVLSGLTTTSASGAMAAGQYIQMPFTTGGLTYADGSPADVKFYVNTIGLAPRWLMNAGNPNQFGYAAYVVDGAGTPVGGVIETVPNVSALTDPNFRLVRAPDGPGPGIELNANTAYALRFYVFGVGGASQAVWDDTLFTMSRQRIAELSVTTTPVTASPTAGGNDYAYTFTVYSNGPDDTNARIVDPLPGTANGASASWTCVLQPGGTPCATPSGTGPIDANEALTSGQSAVYSVTWSGPSVATSDTHDITVQPLDNNPIDPNSANNATSIRLAPTPAAVLPQPVPGLGWLGMLGLAALLGRVGMRSRQRAHG
ncbi:hypothetical protein CCO03_16360 [Comamonas serinivorans]|uniref:Uncharacterized protein n=1 Tax=Comamonas serinivorans TaxID=1082851 RepID=A0A1Y0ERL3_9BURK|nr:hypothetical protein CCO03_16360 [Comamonas serinivorans]